VDTPWVLVSVTVVATVKYQSCHIPSSKLCVDVADVADVVGIVVLDSGAQVVDSVTTLDVVVVVGQGVSLLVLDVGVTVTVSLKAGFVTVIMATVSISTTVVGTATVSNTVDICVGLVGDEPSTLTTEYFAVRFWFLTGMAEEVET
jgi:hypothetical protein